MSLFLTPPPLAPIQLLGHTQVEAHLPPVGPALLFVATSVPIERLVCPVLLGHYHVICCAL